MPFPFARGLDEWGEGEGEKTDFTFVARETRRSTASCSAVAVVGAEERAAYAEAVREGRCRGMEFCVEINLRQYEVVSGVRKGRKRTNGVVHPPFRQADDALQIPHP